MMTWTCTLYMNTSLLSYYNVFYALTKLMYLGNYRRLGPLPCTEPVTTATTSAFQCC